uniref:Poly [ADP-ribose] polymerase n=1 Tax=Amphimedon queenslandica TaxID=400682 RepID=A0A1X7UHJ5_AMPQE
MAEKLRVKKLKKEQLTIERCEVNYSICVAGITNKGLASEDGLEFYFESSKSGGREGIVEKIEMLAKNKAKVTFKDHSVIQGVLKNKLSRLGPSVCITECSVLDSLDDGTIEDEEEEEDENEEPIKKKSSHKRDNEPGEKYLNINEQKSLRRKIANHGIEMDFQVKVTADDAGIITISPSPSSPPDWPEKAVDMMQEFISSSLTKVDSPVLPEVSSSVYQMIMKECSDEGLQFAFSQGKAVIAGHIDAVTKLHHNVTELCGRMIQRVEEVELSKEDFTYLKGWALSRVQQQHKAVKLQCHDDRLSLSIDGSMKDVNEVKSNVTAEQRLWLVVQQKKSLHMVVMIEPPVESVHYLLLSGLPDTMITADGVEIFLSNSFDEVNNVEILESGTARAEVVKENESIKEFLKKKHKIRKQQIEIKLTDPPDPVSVSTSTATPDALELKYYPDLIEVTFDDDIDTDRLELYFESKQSGGKKEKNVESIKIIEEGVIHVKFKSSEDAAAVIAQGEHSIKIKKIPRKLEVHYVPLPPVKEYDKNKLIIKDIPEGVDEEFLSCFIENCLELDEDDFAVDSRTSFAVLIFESSYTDKELNEMMEKLQAKKLKKEHLTVERCEVTYSIYITGINKSFASEDGLECYFETPKSGGGEGVVEKIEMLGKDKATVTFNDHSVIQRVIKKKHPKLGPSVSITECSVLDSVDESTIEDEEEEEREETPKKKLSNKRDRKTGEKPISSKKSTTKKIKQEKYTKKNNKACSSSDSSDDDDDKTINETDASSPPPLVEVVTSPQVPLNPINHPLDPLLAKYVRLKPDITKGIEMEFQVKITAADAGIITISPSPSSPPDWPEKAVDMMQEFISSSLTKVDLPVPQEVSNLVYQMIMKECSDEGLQYAFGQGNNKVAIAGHIDAVTKLECNVTELCGRMIQSVDEVELSQEDFAYLKGWALSQIQQQHKGVKLQCHDDRLSLSIDGSMNNVNEVKSKLSQHLVHSKVSVNLQPEALKFLHDDQLGRQKLNTMLKGHPEVIPYFSHSANNQLFFLLLCSNRHIDRAEHVATTIQQEIVVQSIDLPQSFLKQISDSKFVSFQTNLAKKYSFSSTVHQNKLTLVSTRSSIADVSREFHTFVTEACSVTDVIHFKRGVWRLLHSTSMEKKWTDLVEDLKKKGIIIVSSSKPTAQEPCIKIKGEVYILEIAKQKVIEFQAAVKERQVTISRPGMGKYFLSNPQGQTMLKGIEYEANVCIEVEINNKNSGDDEPFMTASQSFKNIGFGTTPEMKRVNVIVGDITEFDRADVIVNAANGQLAHGTGIAADIVKQGGPAIQEDSRRYIDKNGLLSDGKAILFTRAGNLPYKAIVHAVGPRWNRFGDNSREKALLKKAVCQSLEKSKGYTSIAIPAISSGVFGFPVDVCANTILKAIVEFSGADHGSQLNDINIVIFEDNINEFLKAAERELRGFQSYSSTQNSMSSSSAAAPSIQTTSNPLGNSSASSTEKRRKIRGSSTPTTLTASTATPSKVSQTTPAVFVPPVKITKGDIIQYQEEAIVNTTDTDLGFGGYVAKEILKEAGSGLQQECSEFKRVAVGSVTVTGGHNLKSKHVLHVVLPGYDGPSGNAKTVLKQVVYKCLEECTRLKLKSLSMPSIGAGNLKYPNDVVARVLMEETASFFQKNQGKTSLQLVHFVIFDQKIYDEFQSIYKNMSSPTSTNIANPVMFPSRKVQASSQSTCSFPLPHGLSLELLQGDISDDDSDAIVNTTQENLKLVGGGVSGALLKKGGQALQIACDSAVAQGKTAKEGKVVFTKATGSLKCKEVFHIAFHGGRNLSKTVLSCLELAEKKRFSSISFPAIDFVGAFNTIGDSSGGLMSYIYNGMKVVKSFFATNYSSDDEDPDKIEAEPIKTPHIEDGEFEDHGEDEVVAAMLANLSLDSEVTLHIYGETESMVGRAEKKLQSTIATTFQTEEIADPSIAAFSDETVHELESFASDHNVDIEIERDPVLHSVNLRGFIQDVILIKDKVRDAMSSITQEQSKKAAAASVSKIVCWIRINSDEEEEEYDEMQNYEIEQAFRNNETIFEATDDDFLINFGRMEERDKITDKTAIVRRLDLTKAKEQPDDWDPMPQDSQGKEKRFHFVTLPATGPEYKTAETAFNKTMTGSYTQILSIQRLQNPTLYKQYAVRKKEMEKHNPKGHQNERLLWHGTSPDTLDKINTRGFDRNFAGKNATYYGKGVYFARDASYSHGYTSPDANGVRHMYYTLVLTGEFTRGDTSMLAPPPKNPQVDPNVTFDATVNNVADPSIFVVYQDAQNYPAYMVNYK